MATGYCPPVQTQRQVQPASASMAEKCVRGWGRIERSLEVLVNLSMKCWLCQCKASWTSLVLDAFRWSPLRWSIFDTTFWLNLFCNCWYPTIAVNRAAFIPKTGQVKGPKFNSLFNSLPVLWGGSVSGFAISGQTVARLVCVRRCWEPWDLRSIPLRPELNSIDSWYCFNRVSKMIFSDYIYVFVWKWYLRQTRKPCHRALCLTLNCFAMLRIWQTTNMAQCPKQGHSGTWRQDPESRWTLCAVEEDWEDHDFRDILKTWDAFYCILYHCSANNALGSWWRRGTTWVCFCRMGTCWMLEGGEGWVDGFEGVLPWSLLAAKGGRGAIPPISPTLKQVTIQWDGQGGGNGPSFFLIYFLSYSPAWELQKQQKRDVRRAPELKQQTRTGIAGMFDLFQVGKKVVSQQWSLCRIGNQKGLTLRLQRHDHVRPIPGEERLDLSDIRREYSVMLLLRE